MKKVLSAALIVASFGLVTNNVFADSVVASYTCKLKEGKTSDDVIAKNNVWLKWVRANVNKDITSEMGTAIIGKQDIFLFVDTYPSLAVWAEATTALDNDPPELKDLFKEVSDCSENKLWKFEPSS